jgi:hypothetical protein
LDMDLDNYVPLAAVLGSSRGEGEI